MRNSLLTLLLLIALASLACTGGVPDTPEGGGTRPALEDIDPATLVTESPTPNEIRRRLAEVRHLGRVETPSAVRRLYESLYRMHHAQSLNEFYELQVEAEACFFASEESGLRLKVDDMGEMTSNIYVQTVSEQIFRDRSVYIDYNIDGSELAGVDSSFCVTYVSKILVEGERSVPYRDVLVTRLSDPEHIIDFSNRKLADVKSTSQLFPSLTGDEVARSSSDRLKMWGNLYYAKGLYDEAEKCFNELIRRTPDDREVRRAVVAMKLKRIHTQ